ncbi:Flp pilus assembly complex ATPase component TadA [Limosilactobacillus agrestis]|uniref:competence type IV pilus ATPase ComGA n=1 Tax=Limosilactobacillus agrestis TaxID=2759748 RepID=UPI001E4E0DF4|nr:competence type IV pilus ATPase ComGA [Limosilactobacillus agrestis]MCD7119259.1 Flp pilus assembly complex ATPase component TadA [Limosilactobacillus agrestis]
MPSFEEELTGIIRKQPSDLYILPHDRYYQLSLAIKGTLSPFKQVTYDYGQHFISYLKYCANMAVSEHRRPQLGAFKFTYSHQKINLRLSSVGDYQGRESLVIRFIYPLNELNFNFLVPNQWRILQEYRHQRGLILFAGPMGAGKTTTMYQLAQQLIPKQIVLTIEDPVEIDHPDFIQLQVNELAGMDYESLLKLGLRHRPDVFIIGEIRDSQTAAMAIQAALSGHLVLGTIHARNAYGVVARLQQLGIDSYYLKQGLTAVSYQRLIPLVNGEQAILCDLLDRHQFSNLLSGIKQGGVSDDWTKSLQQAVENGKITENTARQYRQG